MGFSPYKFLMKYNLLVLYIILFLPLMCYAMDQDNKAATDRANSSNVSEAETPALPEDYYFNIESVSMETEIPKDWKRFDFHGFFGVTSPVKGRDDDSQQPSSRFLDENELTLWAGKRISKKLSFDSELEIKEGFTEYDLEIFKFDYEIIDKLLVFHIGKFKFPLGIERFVEAGTFNKLVDRPLPSIRIIPGTYSDIGGMFHGTVPLPYDTKLRYEIAVTNGLEGPDPKDVQQLWDNNRNKAIGGRLGYECLPGLEIGGSYSRGKYDEDNKLDIDFLGADIQFKRGNLEVRGEYITSHVEQKTIHGDDYSRNGYYLQTSYKYPFNLDYLRYLEGVVRFDSVDPNRNVTDGEEADRVALGINYYLNEHLEFKFEYEIENEPGEEIHSKSFAQAIFRW
ncbi:MAG: hypothetical protein E3K36_14935 [Candidatus Brocadia sp.]|nr:hypothetical protein [Candidatus Brocadia sp.]